MVEPFMAANRAQRRTLTYPIEITVVPFNQPVAGGSPPSPPPPDGGQGRRRRRRRRRSWPATSLAQAAPGGAAVADGAPRLPVHARLGPKADSASHVVAAAVTSAERVPVPPRDASVPPAIIDHLATSSSPEATASAPEGADQEEGTLLVLDVHAGEDVNERSPSQADALDDPLPPHLAQCDVNGTAPPAPVSVTLGAPDDLGLETAPPAPATVIPIGPGSRVQQKTGHLETL
jgi:hypothetical protein